MSNEMQSIEDMIAVLNLAGAGVIRGKGDGEGFNRTIRFTASGVPCWIEWWANVAYLSVGSRYGTVIPFHRVVVDDTWPSFRMGLRFIVDGQPEAHAVRVATNPLLWQVPIAAVEATP